MSEEKLDRRVRRTRKALREAMIALILEKGYEDITIQEITDRADLRRATFYLHYPGGKPELLFDSLKDTFDELVQQIEPLMQGDILGGKTNVQTIRFIFEHVAENADLYRIILTGQGATRIARGIRDYLAGHVLRSLKRLPPARLAVPAEVLANYLAGAELALITWWLESHMPYPPEQMARLAQRLLLDGARGVINAPLETIPAG